MWPDHILTTGVIPKIQIAVEPGFERLDEELSRSTYQCRVMSSSFKNPFRFAAAFGKFFSLCLLCTRKALCEGYWSVRVPLDLHSIRSTKLTHVDLRTCRTMISSSYSEKSTLFGQRTRTSGVMVDGRIHRKSNIMAHSE